MAQFLSKILINITSKTKTFVKDVWSFKNEIKNIKIPNNHKLVSLDVTSLYTNVSVDLLIKIVKEKYNEIKLFTNIPLNEIIIAIRIVLKENVFTFNNTLYKQKFGCSMGNPLSRIAADIVMEHLEEKALNMLNFSTCFFKRYIDDISMTIPDDMIEYTLNIFNSLNEKIKFTHEVEINNKISFLDLQLIHNNDGSISFNWFRKSTWSGRYINYHSEHFNNTKLALIKGLIDRGVLLADDEFINENLEIIKNTLISNDYPPHLIKKQINERLFYHKNKCNNNSLNDNNDKTNYKAFCSIPYIKGLSEKIRYDFKKFNIQVVFRNNKNGLKRFFNYNKDKEKKENTSGIVYKINCTNCSKYYVGQSKRMLKKRIYEHKNNVKTSKKNSGLAVHLNVNSHKFNFENVQILERNVINYQKRLSLESYHIYKNKNNINLQLESGFLDNIYIPII